MVLSREHSLPRPNTVPSVLASRPQSPKSARLLSSWSIHYSLRNEWRCLKKKNTRTTSWISPFIQICTNILQGLFYVGTVGRLIHSPSWTRSKSCMRPTAISNRFEDGRFFKWIHGLSQSLTKQCWCFYFENVTGHSIVIGDLTTGGTVLLTETRRTDDSIGQFCMIMVWMDIFHRVMMMYSPVWVAIFRKKKSTIVSIVTAEPPEQSCQSAVFFSRRLEKCGVKMLHT